MDKIKNGAEEIYLAPETETSEDKGEDKWGRRQVGTVLGQVGTVLLSPVQTNFHLISSMVGRLLLTVATSPPAQ